MTNTRHDLGLLVIPGEDYTAVCIEHVYSYIDKCLKYLVQTDIPKYSFIGLIERLDLQITFFQCAGPLPHETLQLTVAILHGLGAQADSTSHSYDRDEAHQYAEPQCLPEGWDDCDVDMNRVLIPDAITV